MEASHGLLRPIELNPKLSEQVESQLFEAIQKNVFVDGDYLPSENELTKIFGVSRSVIREALLRLSVRGIIKVKKGKGAQVLKPSIDHVLDPFSRLVNYRCGDEGLIYIIKVRQIIEPPVAGLAAEHRSDMELARLAECVSEQKRPTENGIKISEWDIEFHQTLARASGNPVIPIILRPLYDVLEKFHFPVFIDEPIIERTIKSHERILEAVQKKDANAARQAMVAHLTGGEENARNLLKKKS